MKIMNFYGIRHMHQRSDFRFMGHRHGRYEANVILEGAIELTCNGNIYTVPKGHFAIWKPGVFHMSRVISEEGAELISINFDLSDDSFPSGESGVFELNEYDLSLVSVMENSEGEALTRLAEAFFIRLSNREGSAEHIGSGLSWVYHNAVTFMAENLSSDINTLDVAKYCGVCLTTLKKAFSEYAGTGIKMYFTDMKIHKAKELLEKGVGVFEVSDYLAFSSPSYFSQCFKREVGISPQEYKKSKINS